MKTFLNVLYRRILYKIPLKLLLILVAVFGVLFACFSSADDINLPTANWQGNIDDYNGLYDYVHERLNYGNTTIHVFISDSLDFVCLKRRDANNGATYSFDGSSWYSTFNYEWGCTNKKDFYIKGDTLITYFKFGEGFIPLVYDSSMCQTEFNLIPVSSVDSAYCEENNLCSSSDGDLTPGVSNIFINDIFHPGAFNIIMNIPQEIDWDYAYTNSGQNLNIDVVGYNVDYEKMQSVIDLQNYKPTDEDFSEIIGILAPYSKIIIFFVVLFSLWAMIKKPFKSKKL